MLCMTALKAGLPVAVRQLFSFIALKTSEMVTVISSNSSSFPSGGLSEESSEKFYGLLN